MTFFLHYYPSFHNTSVANERVSVILFTVARRKFAILSGPHKEKKNLIFASVKLPIYEKWPNDDKPQLKNYSNTRGNKKQTEY